MARTVGVYNSAEKLIPLIRNVKDFPSKGILFRDITPLMADPQALQAIVSMLAATVPPATNFIASVDARGFIFGASIAIELGLGFVPIRKPGKLPAPKVSAEYDLEYGSGILEMHADAVGAGDRVWIIDDLMATGGTLCCSCQLLEGIHAEVLGMTALIELEGLGCREKLSNRKVTSLITLPG